MSASTIEWAQVALWVAVVASGVYHGINPGMGWPLAVSAGLMERSAGALAGALVYIALGHLLAMLLSLLPFALLSTLLFWRWHVQMGAGVLVTGFGLALLAWRRHPRVLARIPPGRLVLWSFAIAVAHGAGLMLVPIYLGLCRSGGLGHGWQTPNAMNITDLGMAAAVSIVHAIAMLAAGAAMAWLVYRYLGLRFVARSWINLDMIWAVSLILVGGLSLAATMVAQQ